MQKYLNTILCNFQNYFTLSAYESLIIFLIFAGVNYGKFEFNSSLLKILLQQLLCGMFVLTLLTLISAMEVEVQFFS